MESIKQVLMQRDGLTPEEADDLIKEAKKTLAGYLEDGDFFEADNICEEMFGLEPDYIDELF